MAARSLKLAILLIAAVAASTAQCVESCAMSACQATQTGQNVPPCHRHSQNHSRPAPHAAPCSTFLLPDTGGIAGLSAAPPVAAAPVAATGRTQFAAIEPAEFAAPPRDSRRSPSAPLTLRI